VNHWLEGCLVSKEITLGTLFGLQVGDVIPVSVGRADVVLDNSRLFTAAVAEHKGKLCLTSFEDAE
jgi:flagellar motor switch protein FliM